MSKRERRRLLDLRLELIALRLDYLTAVEERIERTLEKVLALLSRPVSTRIVLNNEGESTMPRMSLNAKSKKAAAAPLDFKKLIASGALLEALDASGNVVQGGIDPAKTTVTWTSSDASLLVVTPDATDSTHATLAFSGTAGTVTITATPANNDGSPPLPPATSVPIVVPAGPAVSTTIVLS